MPIYWWIETGRLLFRGLQSVPRPAEGADAPSTVIPETNIDPVKVASRLKILKLQELIEESMADGAPKWVLSLMRSLMAKSLKEFCGGILDEPRISVEEAEALAGMSVSRGKRKILEKMVEFEVVEYMGKGFRRPVPGRGIYFTGVFPVIKPTGLWRIISDCRCVNAWIPAPMPLSLVSISEIFSTVRAFRFFATYDIRQAFFQIPLPEVAKNMFFMACGDDIYRSAVYCMGYAAAPLAQQSVMMVLLAVAVQKAGYVVTNMPVDSESPPRCLIIADKKGRIVGKVICYLDNVLLATDTAGARQRILEFLFKGKDSVHTRCGSVVKGGIHDPDTLEKETPKNFLKGIELSEGEVRYLNIDFKNGETNQVWWNHTDVSRWNRLRVVPLRDTIRCWSGMVGVLMWHWQVSGADKGDIAPIIELSRLLGRTDDYEEILEISVATQAGIQPFVDDLFKNEPRIRERTPLPRHVTFLASDASKEAGAGVMWTNKGECSVVHTQVWSQEDKNRGINVRETLEGIETVMVALTKAPGDEPSVLVLGTDNTTARAAIRHGLYPGEKMVTDRLQEMKRKAKACAVAVKVVHVPGKIMAADAPSRGGKLDPVLCKKTHVLLKEYWKSLVEDEKLESSHKKRERE